MIHNYLLEKFVDRCLPLFHRIDTYKGIYFDLLQAYLKFEQSSGDPARVQILYERAISEFPISGDLWLDYTSYLDKTLKVGFLSLFCVFIS